MSYNKKALTVVREGEFLPRHGYSSEAMRTLATLPLVPRHQRSGMDRFLGTNNTPDDFVRAMADWERMDRSLVGAITARADLARAIHQTGQIGRVFAHDDERRELRFTNEIFEEHLRHKELDVVEAELETRKIQQQTLQARALRDARKILVEDDGNALGPMARRMRDSFRDSAQMETVIREEIARVRASGLSAKVQEERVAQLKRMLDQQLHEEE